MESAAVGTHRMGERAVVAWIASVADGGIPRICTLVPGAVDALACGYSPWARRRVSVLSEGVGTPVDMGPYPRPASERAYRDDAALPRVEPSVPLLAVRFALYPPVVRWAS